MSLISDGVILRLIDFKSAVAPVTKAVETDVPSTYVLSCSGISTYISFPGAAISTHLP